MKRDVKIPIIARVDVQKARYSKGIKLGIDFSNQIDVWARMEFRSRQQVKELRRPNTRPKHEILKDLTTLHYCVREKLD